MGRESFVKYGQRSRRRGVVLLVVLSLLALFAVLMVTFIVASSHARTSADSYRRFRRGDDEPRRQMDRVAFTMLRDTNDQTSVLRGHAFLRDMYGDDGIAGSVRGGVTTLVTGELLQFALNITSGTAENISGFYNGCVLTFISGRAKGVSLRIVSYWYDPNGTPNFPTFRVMVPTGDYAPKNLQNLIAANDQVLINGRPFSGEGFGLNGTDAFNLGGIYAGSWKLDRPHPGPDNGWGRIGVDDDGDGNTDNVIEWLWPGSDDGWASMFPNQAFLPNTDFRVLGYAQGGGDEDYDSIDEQNMFLGSVIYEAPDYAVPIHIEPSFHRTALINFWFNWVNETWLKPIGVPDSGPPLVDQRRLAAFLLPYGRDFKRDTGDEDAHFLANSKQYFWVLDQIVALKRMIILRPLPELNPNFTGGNSQLSSLLANPLKRDFVSGVDYLHNPYCYGPYDVDNDGDGIPDSIWLDVALPVQAGPTGQVAKPLAAILVLDMDGRLNVNAHGFPTAGSWAASANPQFVTQNPNTTLIPQGFGTGPAEIDLTKLFESTTAGTELNQLLFGAGFGRYGRDNVPGYSGIDSASTYKFSQYPRHFFDFANYHVGYETPPDLWGEVRMAMDLRGCPTYTTPNTSRNLLSDHPYELDFSAKIPSGSAGFNSRDRMFDISELEALLRRYDQTTPDLASDAGALGRMSRLVTAFSDPRNTSVKNRAAANRTLVTTHSFDLPVPNLPRPADWPLGRRPKHISELIKERVRDRYVNGSGNSHKRQLRYNLTMTGTPPDFDFFVNPYSDSYHDPLLALQLNSLVSPDLMMGIRMDVNRPFGNGHDDNNNGVIDEHWQTLAWSVNESYKANNGDERVNKTGAPTDPDNDGVIALDSNAHLVRQILARHLYVLAMALKPHNYHFNGNVGTDPDDDEEDAKILAQWAINAVDFRDPDSIMSPFEYDVDPFEPHPGPDGKWGVANVDDNMNGQTDEVAEALARNSDDRLWSVDGIIDDGTGSVSADDSGNDRRRIVWGCERPEVLLSETFAWHDVKQTNTSKNGLLTDDETMATMGDPLNDLDQKLRPLGGVAIELYNPWASRGQRKPAELYLSNGVELDRLAGTSGSPVWRLLFTRDAPSITGDEKPDDAYPHGPATGPAEYVGATQVVYFSAAGSTPGVTNSLDGTPATIWTSAVDIAQLHAGHYALLSTYRGNPVDVADPNTGSTDMVGEYVVTIGHTKSATNSLLSASQSRRIVLHADPQSPPDPLLSWAFVEDNSNGTPTNMMTGSNAETPPVRIWPEHVSMVPMGYGRPSIQPTLAIPIANLNVSESPSYPAVDASGVAPVVMPNGDVVYTDPYDHPFDNDASGFQHPNSDDATKLAANGTVNVFRRVHLQRLANPLVAYNRFTNPYLTIDSMPLDLHVFNGASELASTPDVDSVRMANAINFSTRERGTGTNLFGQNSQAPQNHADTVTFTGRTHVFNTDLKHSLGYLNASIDRTRYQWDYVSPPTTGYDKGYVGVAASGSVPAWLMWNNRPYVSQYELMLVPRTNSQDLLAEFSSINTASGYFPNADDVATITTPPANPPTSRGAMNKGYFNHLLNFFASTHQFVTAPTPPGTPSLVTQLGPDLYHLFDVTHVPSKYLGAEAFLDGNTFATNVAGTELLHPPFNSVSNFRDPGKINLNTITSMATDRATGNLTWNETIWNAILGDNAGVSPEELVESRRGQDTAMTTLTGRISFPPHPSLYANPFRSGDGGALVPITMQSSRLLASRSITQPFAALLNMERPPVESTLLRSNRDAAAVTPPGTIPSSTSNYVPVLASTSTAAYVDSSLHPYFRYRQYIRLGNLTTTRSNVFAVWITIGYFEVDPVTGQLGQEIGAESGRTERHRAFYIIDRTIPVAFEPGKDHNVDRAVLLKRYLE